jgi:2-iminobutanoate/2-iminopropanoate deaminase
MEIKPFNTNKAPAAIGPYSQAMTAGEMMFVSGQLGMDPETGEMVGEDLKSQARQAMENLKNIIMDSGLTLGCVASVDVFLTNMNDFADFNLIYQEYFSEHKPARAVVEVKALPKGGCVEIKCVACRTSS